MNYINFSELQGKTIQAIRVDKDDNEYIEFDCADGSSYRLIYHQDCCATCSIEDICGDLSDLIGHSILVAEEATNRKKNPEDCPKDNSEIWDSFTWTFYKIDTIKGGVTIRWYGESNGYYSEAATFEKLIDAKWMDYYK